MPALEARRQELGAARTQALGISVDSRYCHANWAASLGGVSFPLLADFHPKGEVGGRYDVYLADKGVDDRATVLIDAGGTVRYAKSVGTQGERDIAELVEIARRVDADFGGSLPPWPPAPGVPEGTRVFVREPCAASDAVLLAVRNLHLEGRVEVCNVSRSEARRDELRGLTGGDQAPCLLEPGVPARLESEPIVRRLAELVTGLG